jgi:predicted DNA-binding transcriptional regulator AlpA
LSVKQICQRYNYSESTFHRSVRNQDWFPLPIAISPQVMRWSVAEIDEAMRQRAPRVEKSAPPAQLRARIERAKQTGDLR